MDRSLDRGWLAFVVSPLSSYLLIVLASADWSGGLRSGLARSLETLGGALLFWWFAIPVPYVVLGLIELLLRARRRSLLTIPRLQVMAFAAAAGMLLVLLALAIADLSDPDWGLAKGAGLGLLAGLTFLLLRPRTAR